MTATEDISSGELFIMTMKEMPSDEPVAADQADLIAHAALMLGEDLLMGSDDPMAGNFGPVKGMQVNYAVAEVPEARRAFAALADGGEITMPIAETSWSPMFGMCIDPSARPGWSARPHRRSPGGSSQGFRAAVIRSRSLSAF